MAIMGLGRRVGFYSAWVSIAGFSKFILAWTSFAFGFGIYGLCVSIIMARFVTIAVRLVLGRMLVGMSVGYWMGKVFLPIILAVVLVLSLGWFARNTFGDPSFWRICETTAICEVLFLPLCWYLVLSGDERRIVLDRMGEKFRWIPLRCLNGRR